MNKIIFMSLGSCLLLFHNAQADEIQTAVLVRHPQADVKVYYQKLQLQLQFISPQKALEQHWQKNSLTEDWLKKLNFIEVTDEDAKIKELLQSAPASMELFDWLNDFSAKQNKQKAPIIACEGIDYRLKQMRQINGGEDVQLYINGETWQCQELTGPAWIYATLISSSWNALKFVGHAQELEKWLYQQKFVQSWVSGSQESYKWSQFQFLRNYRRAIFWPSGEITADNWFDPQANLFSHSQPKNTQHSTWVKYGLLAAGGVVLWNALRGKQLVIEF